MRAAHNPPPERLILLVEDNADDVLLTRIGINKAAVLNELQVVSNGLEAIAYLNGDPPYGDRSRYPLPAVVLLDMKMPDTDGVEVLKWIRRHPAFAQLRVVMLTGSNELRQMNEAYQLGANSFMLKPLDRANAAELSRSLYQFPGMASD